jgi:hypothetical protein
MILCRTQKIALTPTFHDYLQLNNELLCTYYIYYSLNLLMCLLREAVSCEAARGSFSQIPYILQNIDAFFLSQINTFPFHMLIKPIISRSCRFTGVNFSSFHAKFCSKLWLWICLLQYSLVVYVVHRELIHHALYDSHNLLFHFYSHFSCVFRRVIYSTNNFKVFLVYVTTCH